MRCSLGAERSRMEWVMGAGRVGRPGRVCGVAPVQVSPSLECCYPARLPARWLDLITQTTVPTDPKPLPVPSEPTHVSLLLGIG